MDAARAAEVMRRLEELYPQARPELNFSNPFETLVATILSAQCTDKRVNQVTARLFPLYPDAFAMAKLEPEQLEPLIRECGLYHNKAKNIVAASRAIVEKYAGQVPSTREELMKLPGVGQKTAGVVLLAAFGDDADPRGHACVPRLAPHRAGRRDHARARGEAAARDPAEGHLVVCAPPADLARPPRLRGAQAGMRNVPAGGRPLRKTHGDRGEAAGRGARRRIGVLRIWRYL